MLTKNPGIRIQVEEEVRIACVMYGGISLAIYMNGIAQELLSLVRSTANNGEGFLVDDQDLKGNERIYREMACRDGALKREFIVDVLSGTSAGGLNAMFLGKALAKGLPDLNELQNLWITEGDITKLLYDKRSVDGTFREGTMEVIPSLLNSRRMYQKLLAAMQGMSRQDQHKPAWAKSLDVFMTATDLRGNLIDIYLTDRKVREPRYRTVFHFTKKDFESTNDAFLAFVGRCTSSIVPAFEPMRLNDIAYSNQSPSTSAWEEYYAAYWRDFEVKGEENGTDQQRRKKEFLNRDFGDGGYLDNKPFTHAIKHVSGKRSHLPVDRKLFYVEPDPIDFTENLDQNKPNAMEHALAALLLPSFESIREDIESVRQRNRVTERMLRMIDHIQSLSGSIHEVDGFSYVSNQSNLPKNSPSDVTYFHVKVAEATDRIGEVAADRLEFGSDSAYRPTVRYLIKALRDNALEEGKLVPAKDLRLQREKFLSGFIQLSFEERRLTYLLRTLHAQIRNSPIDNVGKWEPTLRVISLSLSDIDRAWDEMRKIEADNAQVEFGISLKDLGKILGATTDEQKSVAAREILNDRGRFDQPRQLIEAARNIADAAVAKVERRVSEELAGLSDPRPRKQYENFKEIDWSLLPLTYGTGALESHRIDLRRISPVDALSLIPMGEDQEREKNARKKLLGMKLGHFGAFFDAVGRMQDILWGKLDAAERFVHAFEPDREKHGGLIQRLQISILAQPFEVPDAYSSDVEMRRKAQLSIDGLRLHLLSLVVGRKQELSNTQAESLDFGINIEEVVTRA